MSSLANSVLKLETYNIDGSCPIRAAFPGGSERNSRLSAPAPSAGPTRKLESDGPGAAAFPDAVSAVDEDPGERARALAEQAARGILAEARTRADEILAEAHQKSVAMAEEACRMTADRLEKQLRAEISALREGAAREAGEIMVKAQSERNVMLASAQREIITLAIDIARRIVARELRVSPDVVLSVAAEALAHLPSGTETARLLVNPADIELVRAERERLAASCSGLSTLQPGADPAIERGGCFVQSPGGDVDGRLSTRFEQLEEALLDGSSVAQPLPAVGPVAGGGTHR